MIDVLDPAFTSPGIALDGYLPATGTNALPDDTMSMPYDGELNYALLDIKANNCSSNNIPCHGS